MSQVLMHTVSGSGPVITTYSGQVTPDDSGNVLIDARDVPTLQREGYSFSNGANNLTATSDPTVSDDANSNYGPGSLWLNTTYSRVWLCVDSTVGAAIWTLLSQNVT